MSLHPKHKAMAGVAGAAIADRMIELVDVLKKHNIPIDLTTVGALTYVAADMLKAIADGESATTTGGTWQLLGRSAWRYAEAKHDGE